MSYLNFISCATCHGDDQQSLFQGLLQDRPGKLSHALGDSPYFSISGDFSGLSYFQRFQTLISQQLDRIDWNSFEKQKKWGLVLASTKGITEDTVWNSSFSTVDPYFELLNWIESFAPVDFSNSVVVSNACSSSHGAIELAKIWLDHQQYDHVLVVAADLIGPFTLKGFQSLRALSPTHKVQPFDNNRDGLLLGDGIATAILGRTAQNKNEIKVESVHSLCEGSSATRPDTSGQNLARCFTQSQNDIDLIMSHGTATYYNDLTEANAMELAFKNKPMPKVTASKWSVGHTLGASGMVDLAIAEQIFKTQTVPGVPTLKNCQLSIAEQILRASEKHEIRNIMISSLGFGGMCSAMTLSCEAPGES